MKKVSTIEELLSAIDVLRKLGTIGVQIVPNRGAALLPRDDFTPSGKTKNVFFNEERDVSEKSLRKNAAFLGGKFSVFSDLGEVRRTDRAYLVPLAVSSHFREFYQEVEINGGDTTDSTELKLTFKWGRHYKPIKEVFEIPFSELLNVESKVDINDEGPRLSKCPVDCSLSFSVSKRLGFDCRFGRFEYHNRGGACYSLCYSVVGEYEGEIRIEEMDRRTGRPFILTLGPKGASVQEAIEYKAHTEERNYGPSLSNDERRYDPGGVHEVEIIDKLVWGETRRLTVEEAEEFYSARATGDRRKLREIYSPRFLAWRLGSEEAVAQYEETVKTLAGKRLAARIAESKKIIMDHPFAVRVAGEDYIERCGTLSVEEVVAVMEESGRKLIRSETDVVEEMEPEIEGPCR